MRKLVARVFDYSLDGLIATEDTEFYQFCRDLPDDPAEDASGSEFYAGADLHIMGRVAYQSMASYFPTATDDPNAGPLNAARKVVFSRTLKTADWANTTITTTSPEINLRRGGDWYLTIHATSRPPVTCAWPRCPARPSAADSRSSTGGTASPGGSAA